ncbi:MAG: DUF4911 domain-containing protein [Syntrophobacteraceae bacterium]
MQILPEECSVRNYLIDPCQIHYLRFIIEAYPGMAVVSTVDSKLGLVSIALAPGCESDILQILEAERETLKLSEVDLSS